MTPSPAGAGTSPTIGTTRPEDDFVKPARSSPLRRGGGPLAAAGLAALALLLSCRSDGDSIRDRNVEEVFVRGTTIDFRETAALEARVGDVARFLEGEWRIVTGVGVVVDLAGSGDRGDAYKKTETFASAQPDLRAPPETALKEGAVAMVMVEARIPTWLGTSAGLVGASLRPLGDAASLEGGMLLETSLLDAGSGEVYAVGAGPVLTTRVDAKGNTIKTPKFGRVMKIEVKGRHRPGEVRKLVLDPVWPELVEGAAEALKKAFPALKVTVAPPNEVHCTLPDDPLALPLDFPQKALALPVRGPSAGLSRILCDEGENRICTVGERLHLGRGTFLLGEGVKVVSFAPKGRLLRPSPAGEKEKRTDLAVVEVQTPAGTRKIVTLRWLRQLVRVLDRLGVDFAQVKKLLRMAAETGVLRAEIVTLSPGRSKFLKGGGG
jgi:flagellar basal body P-ring protein FlgI